MTEPYVNEDTIVLASSRDTGEVKAYSEEGDFIGDFILSNSAEEGIPDNPDAFVFGANDDFYLSSTLSGDILRYDASTGNFIEFFVNGGDPNLDTLVSPVDLQLDVHGEKLYVANFTSSEDLLVPPTNNDSILIYDITTGELENKFSFTNGNEGPLGLTLDPSGESLYVGTFADGVWKFDIETGEGEQLIDETEFIPGERGSIAADLLFTDDESLLVADFGGGRILDFDLSDPASITSEILTDVSANGVIGPTALKLGTESELLVSGAFSSNVVSYDLETGDFLETLIEPNEGGLTGTNFGLGLVDNSVLDDFLVPKVQILGAPTLFEQSSFFNIEIEFSEDVSEFTIDDIGLTNATASNFEMVDGNTYTVNITPNTNDNIAIDIPAGVANGLKNSNEAAERVEVYYDDTPAAPIENSFLVASVNNSGIVDFQPDLANPTGDGFTDYDANGFLRIYQPGQSSILRYNEDGSFNSTFVPAGTDDENITVASGLALGPDGLIYINDQATNSVKKYNVYGEFQGYFLNGTAPDTPEEIVIGDDCNGQHSLYVSSLTGDGVRRYDFETGELIDQIDVVPGTDTPLSAALMEFGPDGNLYIGGVFSTNQIIKYDPDFLTEATFVSPDEGQLIPSGIAFDDESNLYNGTFSGPTFGFPPTTIAQYDAEGNLLDSDFVDNSGGQLDISSRVRLFDIDGDGEETFYVSNFGGDNILTFEGPENDNPGAFTGNLLADGEVEDVPVILLSSRDSDEIKAYDAEGNFIKNLVTANSAGTDIPRSPNGISIADNGDLYLSSTISGDVLKYNSKTGDFIELFVDGGNPETDELISPITTELSPDGEKIYVADYASNQDAQIEQVDDDSILVYDTSTGELLNKIPLPNGNEGFVDIALDPENPQLIYATTIFDGVWRFNTETGEGEQFISKDNFTPGDFLGQERAFGAGILFQEDDSLLISDFLGNQILSFDSEGELTGEFVLDTLENGLIGPTALTWGFEGELLVNGAISSNLLAYDRETGAFLETLVESNEAGLDGATLGLSLGVISVSENNPEDSILKNPGGLIYIDSDIDGLDDSVAF